MKKLKRKEYYSTSEVANILKVAVGSIINWVDNGEINAIITPGGHRKIPLKDLLSFLESHNYEIPSELIIKKLVYLIDDEQTTHDFFSHMFKNIKGFELKCFFSGTEALLAIGQTPPRIMIVDILMPDFDGIQVIKNIKESNKLKSIHIIAISGDSSKKQNSLNAGGDVFLQKPFSILEFKDAIAKIETISLGS
ncbi:MAG: response regulator [Spirochaetes bacterium]|nr:response regulator [Spirochaetota bacterium]